MWRRLPPSNQLSNRLHRYTRAIHIKMGDEAPPPLHARRVAVGAGQAAALERRERAAIAVLADAVEDDIEPARQDTREVIALVVDRRGAKLADQRRVRAVRGAPQLEASQPAERTSNAWPTAPAAPCTDSRYPAACRRADLLRCGRRDTPPSRGGRSRGQARPVHGPPAATRPAAALARTGPHFGHTRGLSCQ